MSDRDETVIEAPDQALAGDPSAEDAAAEPRIDQEPATPTATPTDPVVGTVYAPLTPGWARLEEHFEQSLFAVLRNGLEKHRAVVMKIGLDEETPTDWLTRSERLLEYRRTVASELLEPLTASFSRDDIANSVREVAAAALAECVSAAQDLPEEVDAPWRADALETHPSDSAGRRMGKALARVFSSARKTGTTRTVRLRATAVAHVHNVLAPALDRAATETMQSWGEWSGRLEKLWVAWGDAGLPALVQADLPDPSLDPDEQWEALRVTASALDEGLSALIAEAPHTSTAAQITKGTGIARGIFDAELAISGSFLFNPDAPSGAAPKLETLERIQGPLASWTTGVANRMELYESVLAILSGATAVQRRLVFRIREKCLSDASVLPDIAKQLDELAVAMRPWPSESEVDARLTKLEADVSRVLEPALAAIPPHEKIEADVRANADTTVEALVAMIRQAPAQLMLHAEDAKPPTGSKTVEERPLAVQEVARQSFDALRVERIRTSAFGVVEDVDQVREDIKELPRVFAFAYEAARSELEENKEGAEARAAELIGEALRSISESLRSVKATLDRAVDEAKTNLANEICEGALALFDRVAAGRVHARLLAARSGLTEARAWVNERWGPPVNRAYQVVKTQSTRAFKGTQGLFRRGIEMVTGSAATEAASRRTLRALSDATDQVAELPLVYQRLFTLEPLEDASLLASREAELADAMARWKRWHAQDGVPFIIRGRPGSGITSFINILSAKLKEGEAQVVKVMLKERIHDEAGFTAKVSEALGLECGPTIDDLSRAIFEADDDSLPGAISLDNLEHLFLRVPHGTDLIERVLTLMAETEPKIFWIGGITTSAWQLVAMGEPTAVAQLDILDLPPLSAADTRAAIHLRHRRSGLPVHFEEPPSGRRMLRRKLRRMRDPGAFADILEADYFDQLHRTSSGNLRLALFQWLLSADFTRGDGVTMKPPERPDFSVLDSLGLPQNFTLKAFLEHRTLSLAEHDRIFRLPRHESYQIFESLSNRHLLEPIARKTPEGAVHSEIEVDLRYRLRPLLVGAVVTHLSGRNIVH